MTGVSANLATAAEEEKKAKKKPDPAARFAKLDKDSDCKLSADELKAGFKKKPEMAEKILKAKDKNKDGNLSKEEFVAKRTPKKKGDAAKKYLDTYFAKAWAHFDVNRGGVIEVIKMPMFMRFLASDQYMSLGE